eukprot:COSAG05_NODE_47_length_24712_cov_26.673844_14_plen_92_part_00
MDLENDAGEYRLRTRKKVDKYTGLLQGQPYKASETFDDGVEAVVRCVSSFSTNDNLISTRQSNSTVVGNGFLMETSRQSRTRKWDGSLNPF